MKRISFAKSRQEDNLIDIIKKSKNIETGTLSYKYRVK